MKRRAAAVAALASVARLPAVARHCVARSRAADDSARQAADAATCGALTFPTLDASSRRLIGPNFQGTTSAAELLGHVVRHRAWQPEMPLLDRFAKERASSGWRVLALAIDGADPVRKFVAERSLALPIALAGAEGIDLSRVLGNKLGALPFSVVFNLGR